MWLWSPWVGKNRLDLNLHRDFTPHFPSRPADISLGESQTNQQLRPGSFELPANKTFCLSHGALGYVCVLSLSLTTNSTEHVAF